MKVKALDAPTRPSDGFFIKTAYNGRSFRYRQNMQRVDMKVGFACNNRCRFCVQGNKRAHYPQRTLEEICASLAEEYAKGLRAVVFTGGEPTVHADLIAAIAFAKEIGYRSIQIQSNGCRFADEEYLDKLIAAGANEF